MFVFATVDQEFAQQEICEKFDWQIHSAVTARWRDTPNTQSQQGVCVYTMTERRFSRTKTTGYKSEKKTYCTSHEGTKNKEPQSIVQIYSQQ
jgi:hypothetical protein